MARNGGGGPVPALPFGPYEAEKPGAVPTRSVALCAIVLTKDEEVHIERCLRSLQWCDQVLVVDSGSTDRTVELASGMGADVIATTWRGYGGQRAWALRQQIIRHDWIYFVDADEWISNALASEISQVRSTNGPEVAWQQRFRLIWEGTFIRHCGWYGQSWITRLMRRDVARFDPSQLFSERAYVEGAVGRLQNDIVDESLKGLHGWMAKHVQYAATAAADRSLSWPQRRALLTDPASTVPLARRVLKYAVFPAVPGKPFALWLYMVIVKRGFLHGRIGLRFATLHAIHQYHIDVLQRVPAQPRAEPVPAERLLATADAR